MQDDRLIKPVYQTKNANESICLGRSQLDITSQRLRIHAPARVSLTLRPVIRLTVDADLSHQPFSSMLLATTNSDIKIQYGPHSPPTNALLLGTSLNANIEGTTTSSATFVPNPEHLTICPNRRKRLSSLVFHVLNFSDFHCTTGKAADLRFKTSSGELRRLGCVCLLHEEWQIELQTLPSASKLIKQLNMEGGYAITHVGRLTRRDGRSFWASQAETLLDDLHYFLSFARGLWTPPILPVGFDVADNRVYEVWGTRLVTAWGSSLGWFDIMNGQSLSDLFPGFAALLHHPVLAEPVKTTLYWYLRSNRAGEGAGVDSGVILSQAALERLTSAYLSHVGLSNKNDRMRDQFSRAFQHMKLPTAIPRTLRSLNKGKRGNVWKDLPDAIVKIRNELTHAKPKLKVALNEAIAEVWNVAQWYVELSILRLSGYHGVYFNRLNSRWVGEVETVPWQRQSTRKR